MGQTLFIPGPLPELNNFLGKGTHWPYTNAKKKWYAHIAHHIIEQKLAPMCCVRFHFIWQELDRRRDPDNFTAIGKKFILDALVKCGVMKNDGWANVAGWSDEWVVIPERPGVLIFMEETNEG